MVGRTRRMLTRLSSQSFLCGAFVGVHLMVLVPAAWADTPGFDDHISCAGASCEVGARVPGHSPVASGTPSGERRGEGGQDGPPCAVPDVDFAQSGQEGPLEMPLGMAQCEGAASTTSAPVFEPAMLAEQARVVMRLPDPDVGTAPPLGKPRFVNMPSWMWIDAADWEPVSATASVSAGSVTATATPQQVVWDTGDGHEVICEGHGTVFSRAVYREEGSPDCGHTYTALPPGGAGALVDLTAVWAWEVTWSTTDGRGGDLEDLTTSSTVAVPVSEIHSVVTNIR